MATGKYPQPTAGALIFNPKGEVLLVQSHKWRGKWVMPGGRIQAGEKIVDALKREIIEETGLKIYDIKFVNFLEFIYDKHFWRKKHFIFLDFACKTKDSKVKLNDEAEKFCWVKPEKASKMPVEPYTKRAIRTYLRQSIFHSSFPGSQPHSDPGSLAIDDPGK
jgi:nucleoside triphosphatase